MPSPKDGKAGQLVNPAAPRSAKDADVADPGEVEKVKARQQQLGTGKYGEQPVKPFKPPTDSDDPDKPKPTAWIEIVMVDETGAPVPGLAYQITLPDSSVASGTLDEKGFARVEGFDPGSCQISFPGLDESAWQAA
jgi:type VI secretion system secreted protein VgrG